MSERPISPLDADTVRDGSSKPGAAWKARERYLGPYRLLRHIGGGGMGVVYQAEDPRLGRTVALKLLPPELTRDPRAKTRFLQEARAASALDHPNICSIYEVGETDDLQLYLAMPCYDGETLRERIDRGPLPIAEVLDIASQVSQGLAKAHQRGIVHRDIKPANLMITSDGLVKILDFGTAKLVGSAGLTRTGSVIGTPAYMSPEQMNGDEVDERTDLWSLGVVIYEMVTGRRPFRGDHHVALREAILHATPEPLGQRRPDAPVELGRLVSSLLAKDPAARPASAEVVARKLRDLNGIGSSTWWRPRFHTAAGLVLLLPLAGVLSPARHHAPSKSGNRLLLAQAAGQTASAVPAQRRPSLVVLGFRDLTSEDSTRGWLGPALTEMLTTELAAGAQVRVMASERAVLDLRSRQLASLASMSSETLDRLHALAGTDLAVLGSFLPLEGDGDRTLRLDIRVLTLPAGETVASIAEVGPESELFNLVGRVGERLRRVLGISLPTEEQAREARQLLPAGSAAIRLYTEALVHLRAYEPGKARDLLLQAEQLDPTSPVIRSALSQCWALLGYDAQAREAALLAFELRHSLPQETQLVLEARLYMAERRWSRASDVYRSLWTFFPDEMEYGLQLASALMMEGRGSEGIAVLEELRKHPAPDGEDPRIDLVAAQTAMRIADFPLEEKAAAATVVRARRLGAHLLLARALIFQSHALLHTGRAREAVSLSRQAEELARREGDRWLTGMALANLGAALQGLGQWQEAERAHASSLEIARDIGTEIGIGSQLICLGELRRDRGDSIVARDLLEQSVESARKFNDQVRLTQTLASLSPVVLSLGEADRAAGLLEEALSAARVAKNRKHEVRAIHGLAALQDLEGDLEQALRMEEEALRILRDLDDPALAASVLASSADLLRRTGHLPLAQKRIDQAIAAGERAGNALLDGQLLEQRARFACGTGDLALCRSSSQAALDVARQLGARPLEAAALRQQARAAEMSGDLAPARSLLLESLRLSTDMGDQLASASTRIDLARVELKQGDRVSAERMAKESAQWYRERSLRGGEAAALAVLNRPALSDRTVTKP